MTRPFLEEMNARCSLIAIGFPVQQSFFIKMNVFSIVVGIFGMGCMVTIVLSVLVDSGIWAAIAVFFLISGAVGIWKYKNDMKVNSENQQSRKKF